MPLGWGLLSAEASGLAVVTLGRLAPDAAEAIEAAGARVTAKLDWDAVDSVSGEGRPLVIAAAYAGIGHGELERLASVIEAEGLRAIIVCERDAVDAVWAVLPARNVELFSDPDPGDWATALAFAALEAAGPRSVREGGDSTERLRRLHAEVARIAAQLGALAEDPASEAEETVADRRTRYAVEPGSGVPIDPAEIRRAIRARRMRAQFFDARLLEDPGWDMLLDLFAAELEGIQVSVSSLCIAGAVAPTTALRWISRMVDAGLMVRVADLGDRRRAFVALSERAGRAMRGYVGAVKRAGLGVV
jgi:DNA-binding MarR family transcriptional regulator